MFGLFGSRGVIGLPLMPEEDIRVLSDACERASVYVEYGMGGSTRLALEHGLTVFSVETDRGWVAATRAALGRMERLHLIHADVGHTAKFGRPANLWRTRSNRESWTRYVAAPWREALNAGLAPDLVLIDGRFRVACAAMSLVRTADRDGATILVHDYNTRPEYWAVEAVCRAEPLSAGFARLHPGQTFSQVRAEQLLESYATDPR